MTSRKIIEQNFKQLAKMLGKETGQIWTYDKIKKQNKAKVGAWSLDYNSIYGGYNINEIMSEGGGVDLPFGYERKKPKQFNEELKKMIRALELKRGKQ
jgi:hypothetical protein